MNPETAKEFDRILEILKTEDIRFFDGRYKDGFVNSSILTNLVTMGKAKICFMGDIAFVTIRNNK